MFGILHHYLEFLAGVERHHTPGRYGHFFTGLRIASGPLGFFAALEIAEAGELHGIAGLQGIADFLEERFHHVLGFALVESHFFE